MFTPMVVPDDQFYSYRINQSLIFNDNDSSRLEFNPSSSASDDQTKTVSFWIKRANIGLTSIRLFEGYTNADANTSVLFQSDDTLLIHQEDSAVVHNNSTSMVFRDTTNWYHIHIIFDYTNATGADRLRLYVNGVRVTFGSSSNPNTTDTIRFMYTTGSISGIGFSDETNSNFFDGHMAEFYGIDGLALEATEFGRFKNGVWIPKRYTGIYGNNGFYLDFANSSDLGNDVSGNNNDFTSFNFTSDDQVSDSPTNNYPTFNSLHFRTAANTFSYGNLNATNGVAASVPSNICFPSTGKWYVEFTVVSNTSQMMIGVASEDALQSSGYFWQSSEGYAYYGDGNKYTGGSGSAYGDSFGLNDIIGILWDADTGTLRFTNNGVSQGDAWTGLTIDNVCVVFGSGASNSLNASINFGQKPFSYTPPTGYKELSNNNLTEPSVDRPKEAFDIALYIGNGSSQDITGISFPPNFVWIKGRNYGSNHTLWDTNRGSGVNIFTDINGVEQSNSGVTSFNSDGISLGDYYNVQNNGSNFIAWLFREDSRFGFTIQDYIGNGTSGLVINHSLGGVPELMLVNYRGGANGIIVYHHHALNKTDPETDYANLINGNAFLDALSLWNDTAPTSTTFTVGDNASVNTNGGNHIAYLFRSINGFSKVFSYTGNGNADGPFVHLGFKPMFILCKVATTSGNWVIVDLERDVYNPIRSYVYPDLSNTEGSLSICDFMSTGFKVKTSNALFNTNNQTYVGVAFADLPGKYSNAF